MENTDEKFFEELAQKRAENEQKFEIQVAKAKTATRIAPPKVFDQSAELTEGTLTIDVYQNENEIIVESAIAGVRPEDLDITATNESIAIKGERHRDEHVSDERYFYQECFWGKFSRSVILPQEVDPEAAQVGYKNGILTIKLPKVVRHKTKRLNIRMD